VKGNKDSTAAVKNITCPQDPHFGCKEIPYISPGFPLTHNAFFPIFVPDSEPVVNRK
jgi:hypothetical protein